MRSYISLFIISLVTTLLATPIAGRIATRLGAVDIPDNQRRVHSKPTPRMGGIAIYFAFLVTLAIVPFLKNDLAARFYSHPQWYGSIIVAATIVFALGIYDDLRGSNAWLKIAVQVVAACVLEYSGFGTRVLSLPFIGENFLMPVWVSYLFTVMWVVGITNAFNLVDGIDGLASGISAFALLSILVTSVAGSNFEVGLLAIVLLGAVIGFLYHNFHPASIFLGDSGSLTIGFLVATFSLVGAQKGTTTIAIAIPLVSFGLPVVEVFLSLVRRFVGGKPLMQSDRGHIHHRLLDHGLSVRQAAIVLYGVCGLFCLFGILLLNPQRAVAALVFCVLGVFIVLGVQRLRYPEFQELGQKLRKGVVQGRRRIVANVTVRQMSAEIRRAESGDRVFNLLNEICEVHKFDGMVLELIPQIGQMTRADLLSAAEKNGWRPERKDESNSIWGYSRTGVSVQDLTNSQGLWSLKVPLVNENRYMGNMIFYHDLSQEQILVDLTNICGAFQVELSEAIDSLLRRADGEMSSVRRSATLVL